MKDFKVQGITDIPLSKKLLLVDPVLYKNLKHNINHSRICQTDHMPTPVDDQLINDRVFKYWNFTTSTD